MLDYHKIIEAGIELFGEKYLNKEILSISKGGNLLYIHHPTNKKLEPMAYKPDRIFTLNNRQKIVFQVLGTQKDKNREIEADLIRAFLCPEVSKIVFIVPTEEYYHKVTRIFSIMQDTLIGYSTNVKSLPICIAFVIPESVKSAKKVDESLVKVEKRLFQKYS